MVCKKEVGGFSKRPGTGRFCSQACVAILTGKKNKGRIMTQEHKDKTVESARKNFGRGHCKMCGVEFPKYRETQIVCPHKECQSEYRKWKYENEKITNPVRALARRITGSIKLKDKRSIIEAKLKKALGKPCTYCGDILVIENASLDHKIPRKFSKVYDRKTRKRIYDLDVIRRLDSPGNLHIVCRECNKCKLDMDDKQYRIFLEFTEKYPDIGKLLKKRLKWARMCFSRK